MKIVQVTFDSPLLLSSIGKNQAQKEVRQQIIDWLGKWRKYMASKTNLSVGPGQIEQETDFLVEFYPKLTIADLAWMQELYIYKNLPMEYPEIVVFNPDFLSRVIRAYRQWKRQKGERLLRMVETKIRMAPKGTPEMNVDGMRYMIEEVHRQLEEGTPYVFMLPDVYQYLRRTGEISAEGELTEAAKSYIAQRSLELQKAAVKGKDTLSMKELLQGVTLTGKEHQRVYERLAMEWAVKDHFSRYALSDVLKKVTIKSISKKKE